MTKIIALANHKGGVSKTTSTQNIGSALARFGKRVLLVDFDPQANLSDSFGFGDEDVSIYDVLDKDGKQPPIKEIYENLHLIPANLNLAASETELSSIPGREFLLSDILKPLHPKYDFILIDCPPSLGILTINALTSATDVFIPMDSQYFSMKGLDKLKYIISRVQKRLNPSIKISGVFLTKFDVRVVVNKEIKKSLEEEFGDVLFATNIRRNVALVEGPIQSRDIFEYAPSSNGAQDYLQLTEEILKRFESVTPKPVHHG